MADEPVKIEEKVKNVTGAARARIVEDINDLSKWCKDPLTKVTRSLLLEKMAELRDEVGEAFDTLVGDVSERVTEFVDDTCEKYADERDTAVGELEDIQYMYDTALRILEEDAHISERDIDEAGRHASPVSYLRGERDRKRARGPL